MQYTDDNYIANIIKHRAFDAHKGDFGKILIFAGSVGMAGAAVLCGKAALKTGSGLVQFLLPALPCDIYPILQTAVPEATCVAYKEGFDFDAYDAIAAGSGIGQSETSLCILKDILSHYGKTRPQQTKTLLLDADALNLISKDSTMKELVQKAGAKVIITPHIGEAKRLLNTCEGIASLSARKNAACDLAEQFCCIAVLKGSGTLVCEKQAFPSCDTEKTMQETSQDRFLLYENITGNPGMATAGSGDTLSGIITSLAGQGYDPLDAARIGVFIHGKAGDLAAEAEGEMSVTASDITAYISEALKLYY